MSTFQKVTLACVLLTAAVSASAECEPQDWHCEDQFFRLDRSDHVQEYGLGIRRFDSNGNRIITGWQLNDHWYFGHEHKNHSDFGVVRRGERSELSIGNKGVELTLRF